MSDICANCFMAYGSFDDPMGDGSGLCPTCAGANGGSRPASRPTYQAQPAHTYRSGVARAVPDSWTNMPGFGNLRNTLQYHENRDSGRLAEGFGRYDSPERSPPRRSEIRRGPRREPRRESRREGPRNSVIRPEYHYDDYAPRLGGRGGGGGGRLLDRDGGGRAGPAYTYTDDMPQNYNYRDARPQNSNDPWRHGDAPETLVSMRHGGHRSYREARPEWDDDQSEDEEPQRTVYRRY